MHRLRQYHLKVLLNTKTRWALTFGEKIYFEFLDEAFKLRLLDQTLNNGKNEIAKTRQGKGSVLKMKDLR